VAASFFWFIEVTEQISGGICLYKMTGLIVILS
jgi:hypothetical protein